MKKQYTEWKSHIFASNISDKRLISKTFTNQYQKIKNKTKKQITHLKMGKKSGGIFSKEAI